MLWVKVNCSALTGLLISMVVLALAGCATNLDSADLKPNAAGGVAASQAEAKQRRRPVTVAMILPLKGFGQTALIGKSLKQAGELALFDADNQAVQLIVKNDDGSPQGAAAAAREAISEGAEVIVGPLFGASVSSVAAVARPTNVPVLTFSNDRNAAGNGAYLMSYLPNDEVDRVVAFALQRGKRTFATLIPTGVYGDTVERAFQAAVSRGGGRIVVQERFEPRANAMLEPAKRVVETINDAAQSGVPVDALFLPGNQSTLPSLGPQLAFANLDTKTTQLIGLGGWEYPNIGRDEVFVGGWYPGPDPAGWKRFSERFAQTFGNAPPRVASHAHDAVSLAISLSSRPKGQRFTQANLTMPAGFEGVDGRFTLNPDGTTRRGLVILEVQKFGSKVIAGASGSSTTLGSYSTNGAARGVNRAAVGVGAGAVGGGVQREAIGPSRGGTGAAVGRRYR
ncbi:MAG: penicillin-binding protein activator [Alphaproteobacteria bacterium]|nr:penicillin-binding protein activator [Alphaproteobacteria bacterium]